MLDHIKWKFLKIWDITPQIRSLLKIEFVDSKSIDKNVQKEIQLRLNFKQINK
jgi:hypothetical protein